MVCFFLFEIPGFQLRIDSLFIFSKIFIGQDRQYQGKNCRPGYACDEYTVGGYP